MYGMGESAGLVHVGQRHNPMFLDGSDGTLHRDCSEDTAREIDREIRKILDDTYADTKRILVEHRNELEVVAKELLTVETLDSAAFARLIGRAPEAVEKREPPLTPPPEGTEASGAPLASAAAG